MILNGWDRLGIGCRVLGFNNLFFFIISPSIPCCLTLPSHTTICLVGWNSFLGTQMVTRLVTRVVSRCGKFTPSA